MSVAACELLLASDFVDLHVVTEVPVRLVGYDPLRRHPPRRRPLPLIGHADIPRLLEAGYSGVVWDITTNPFWPRARRQRVTLANLERVCARLDALDEVERVTDAAGYDAARRAGRMAAWVSIQGGNALIHDPSVLQGPVGRRLSRVTLVHLTRSGLGGVSAPTGGGGLTPAGADFIERCVDARIAVDLAHASRQTFWDALPLLPAGYPPLVSHAGATAVHDHWRNLDNTQIQAVAERGGVVGVIYQAPFLEGRYLSGRRAAILDHIEHLIDVGGETVAALGSDYDGFILPPADLPDVTTHPLLVQDMLDRGWREERIRRVAGANAVRIMRELRPGSPPG